MTVEAHTDQGEDEKDDCLRRQLRLNGADDAPIHVVIDLTDDRLSMKAGEVEVADWSRQEIRVSPMLDGFHIRAEGEE